MKRQNYILLTLAFLAVLVTLVAACAAGKTEPAETGDRASLDGKALTEERCTKCHDLKRVESAKKSADEWKTTVERMVGKGAELNTAEQAAVSDYLTKAYPE